jgi:hypothetical protein
MVPNATMKWATNGTRAAGLAPEPRSIEDWGQGAAQLDTGRAFASTSTTGVSQ